MKSQNQPQEIPELGFQVCSDKTVRAVRFNGENLLWTRTVGNLSTAVAVIDSFRRENRGGKISIENAEFESVELKIGSQLVELFDRAEGRAS